MSVEHIVWLRFKEGVSRERIEHHMANLLTLGDHIPGIIDLCLGESFTDRADGHTLGVIVTLDSRTSLENYIVHDYHVQVATPLKEDCDSVLALDFEH